MQVLNATHGERLDLDLFAAHRVLFWLWGSSGSWRGLVRRLRTGLR